MLAAWLLLLAAGLASADRLENTYLPPANAATAGGAGLAPPSYRPPSPPQNSYLPPRNNPPPPPQNSYLPPRNNPPPPPQNSYLPPRRNNPPPPPPPPPRRPISSYLPPNRAPTPSYGPPAPPPPPPRRPAPAPTNSYLPPTSGGNGGYASNGGYSSGGGFSSGGGSFGSGSGYNGGGFGGAGGNGGSGGRPVAIIKQVNENNGDGTYTFSYETDNGIQAEERGELKPDGGEGIQSAQGSFSFTAPDDGQRYSVQYTADERGFLAYGDHLPTPPPIPEAIQRALAQNAQDEANGVVDDGSYNGIGATGANGGYPSGPAGGNGGYPSGRPSNGGYQY